MKLRSKISDIWKEQSKEGNNSTLRANLIDSNSFKCFVGRIGVSDAKMVQIILEENTPIHKNYLKRFHGVEIRSLGSVQGKKDITIILSDNDLIDVFVLFTEDLIEVLLEVENIVDIPFVLNQKVNYWGRLFAKFSGALLSKEKQRGLFGELVFLKHLIEFSGNPGASLNSWSGPNGANQDFSNELTATEIKSSKSTKPKVNIASEYQLDDSHLDNLFLLVYHLDEINNGVDSLKNVISDIKVLFNNDDKLLKDFTEKLDRVGIPEGEEKQYDKLGFYVRSTKAFKVESGFPMLTKDSINNEAIYNVKYQIDLNSCSTYEVSYDEVLNKMKEYGEE